MRIALLTDFGTRDPYVAAMRGVISGRCDAPLFDLTHEIAPFDVFEAAWFLRGVLPYWRETVFVCVVDPGVGTTRRIVAARNGSNVLLAPDNGLLHFAAREGWSIENEALFLPHGSTTFHGRDRFAPVAAAIAKGLAFDVLGPRVHDLVRLDYEEPVRDGDIVRGTIVQVDRFGNLITDIIPPFARYTLRSGEHRIDRIARNYGDAGEGAFLIVGSTGCVEISVANASAAERLHITRLDRVELCAAS